MVKLVNLWPIRIMVELGVKIVYDEIYGRRSVSVVRRKRGKTENI